MTIKIDFDGLEPGTTISNQFHTKGLLFTTPAEITQDPETFSHVLQPNHIVPDRHHPDHQPMRIIRGRFVGGNKHSRVAVAVSFCDVTSDGVSAVLRLFDYHGDLLDEKKLVSSGCDARAEITCPTSNVASFEVAGPVDHFQYLTGMEFDCLPDADFRMVYDGFGDPLMLRADPEQVVTARISFFRLHGSRGDILLSVTNAPAGVTWSFQPEIVHSGIPHVDVEIRACDGARPVSNFNIEVVGSPRQKDAGRHERSVTIPVTILPSGATCSDQKGAEIDP